MLTSKIIAPEGPRNAKIFFLGEAPGEEEDNFGRNFVGSAGQLLNRCLQEQGIVRSDCLVGNIFWQRPPRNDLEYFYKDITRHTLTDEGYNHVKQTIAFLEKLKKENHLPLLVAFGREALYILTGKEHINKWRGSVLPCTLVEGFTVYPMFHPSYVNRLQNEKEEVLQGEKKKQAQNALPTFLIDLSRVQQLSVMNELPSYPITQDINLSLSQILARLEAIETGSSCTMVSVDIETIPTEWGPILWMIGFAESSERGFTIFFLKNMQFARPKEDEARILQAVSKVFLSDKVKKIFQGGQYDLVVLGHLYGLRLGSAEQYEDTMWAHHSVYPSLPKSLQYLTSIYTWMPYYKDEGKHVGSRNDIAEANYNIKDCCVTFEVFKCAEMETRIRGFYSGYRRSMSYMPSLFGMMLRGIKIDVNKKNALADEFSSIIKGIEEDIYSEAKYEFNINSSEQKRRLLYGMFGFKIQVNHKTGKPSVDKDALNKLSSLYPAQKIIGLLLEYSKYEKLSSTYTSMAVAPDGRIRTRYNFVSTWRLGSSESDLGFGGNLQNIPSRSKEGRMIRKLFIPDEGKTLLAADGSQAEARVVAWLSNDRMAMDSFLDPNTDVHWENAKTVFVIEKGLVYIPDESIYVPIARGSFTMKVLRQIGKTIVHATNYRMGPRMLQTILTREGINFDEKTCKGFIDNYRSKRPFLCQWQERVIDEVCSKRVLETPMGRKRLFLGRLNDSLYRSAIAFVPQSTVGELLQEVIQNCWDKLNNFDILLNVHDEVVGQCDSVDIPHIIPHIKSFMERTIDINSMELCIPAEFKTGPSWGELKEIK